MSKEIVIHGHAVRLESELVTADNYKGVITVLGIAPEIVERHQGPFSTERTYPTRDEAVAAAEARAHEGLNWLLGLS